MSLTANLYRRENNGHVMFTHDDAPTSSELPTCSECGKAALCPTCAAEAEIEDLNAKAGLKATEASLPDR